MQFFGNFHERLYIRTSVAVPSDMKTSRSSLEQADRRGDFKIRKLMKAREMVEAMAKMMMDSNRLRCKPSFFANASVENHAELAIIIIIVSDVTSLGFSDRLMRLFASR